MNRELFGEPGVSAFLRSVRQNLSNRISQMKPNDNNYNQYDHTQDLEKLKVKLLFFQDLLVDGEARRLGEECVDVWMDDIKHLLYDVEDILDDLKSQCTDDQVRLYELNKKNVDSLENILSRIEELKDTAKDLELKRGRGYALGGNSNVFGRTRETTSMVEKYETIHGREEDKNVIVKRLLEVDDKGKQSYDVLCLVGMGGLGKTTLAQLVFNDPKVVRHFDVKIWVCISNVFDVARATKELILNSGNRVDELPLESLQRRLSEIVEKKKNLFVFDDVWSLREWETMKVPFGSCAKGSKILVTTRNIKIAHCFGNFDHYPVQELNHEQCMKLFRDKAFRDDKGEHNKEVLVKNIVRACKGVPLVIKVVGSMLRFADVEKWRAVSENTISWANENDEIHPAIRFSYYDLPTFLKRCFEYLAMFPPDFIFRQDEVVRLWISDGLVQEVDGRKAEDIGAEYYNELKARSLIQEDEVWKNDNKMHDIVHYLATVVSRKFCYKKNSNNSPARVRHAFVDNWEGMHSEFLAQAPCLRTLIVQSCEDKFFFPKIIRFCKTLRTLKFGDDFYNPKDLDLSLGGSVIDQLTHIRYLNIPYSDIRHLLDCRLNNLMFLAFLPSGYGGNLPDGFNHLSELQTLHLAHCESLTDLPKDFGNLKSLRNLLLEGTAISSLPESICALSELHTLNLSDVNSLTKLPKDIGKLRSLRNLYLQYTAISSLPESICALSELQTLDLKGCDSLTDLPKDFGNLRSLQNLYLKHTAISSLPESICALSHLQALVLRGCKSLTDLPKEFGNLRSLRNLYAHCTGISSLPESTCALSELQILNLVGCKSLTELPKDIGKLRSLKELELSSTSISSLPESICALNQLQVLELLDCMNLQGLPKDIGNLSNLQRFVLSRRDFFEPISLFNITGLEFYFMVLALHSGRVPSQVLNEKQFHKVTIGGVEDALMADLKSKKVCVLHLCCWTEPADDEEMELKIVKVLKPHRAVESLKVTNYRGDNLPLWMMPVNICYSKLQKLKIEGFNKICEMVDMEFVSLKVLRIKNCPKLKKVLMATPKLDSLYMHNCGELEAVDLLTSLSDKDGMRSILSRLLFLSCDYNIFEYFFEKFASLPGGWPGMMESLWKMIICDIRPGKLQLLPDGDRSAFPPSLRVLYINHREIKERPLHHSYTITLDGRVESEE